MRILTAFRTAEAPAASIRRLAALLGAVIAFVDLLAGPRIHVPVLFILPVLLCAWFGCSTFGLAIGSGLSLGQCVVDVALWKSAPTFRIPVTNAALSMMALALIAALTYHAGRRVRDLSAAVQVLHDRVRICPTCRRICSDTDRWQSIDEWVAAGRSAERQLTCCPACAQSVHAEREAS